jgi:hypothetical protein
VFLSSMLTGAASEAMTLVTVSGRSLAVNLDGIYVASGGISKNLGMVRSFSFIKDVNWAFTASERPLGLGVCGEGLLVLAVVSS